MQTAPTIVTVVAFCLLAQSSAAPAPQSASSTMSTMERCAKLLPQGRRYTFGINGTIDYSGAAPILHGELSLANDTNDDLTLEGSNFAQCFAKLVR